MVHDCVRAPVAGTFRARDVRLVPTAAGRKSLASSAAFGTNLAMPREREQGVVLPEGHTGSSFFLHVLKEAVAKFPHVLQRAELPNDPREWKRAYRDALVR